MALRNFKMRSLSYLNSQFVPELSLLSDALFQGRSLFDLSKISYCQSELLETERQEVPVLLLYGQPLDSTSREDHVFI